jgi:arabinogalactan endo-1,4-beta-galactosidase
VWIPNNYSRAQFYERLQKTIDYLAGLQKPVIISEASYHHQTYMTECMGPFGPEPCPIVPMPDYPLTPSGQAAWVRDQLRYASNHPNVAGFFYFYPDWFPRAGVPGTEALQTAGLFASDTQVLPALQEFRVNLP